MKKRLTAKQVKAEVAELNEVIEKLFVDEDSAFIGEILDRYSDMMIIGWPEDMARYYAHMGDSLFHKLMLFDDFRKTRDFLRNWLRAISLQSVHAHVPTDGPFALKVLKSMKKEEI